MLMDFSFLADKIEHVEILRCKASLDSKRLNRFLIIFFFITLLLSIIVLSFAQRSAGLVLGVVITTVLVNIIVGLIARSKMTSDSHTLYKSAYKSHLIEGIAKRLQPQISYEPEAGVPQQTFDEIGHYVAADRYRSEDLFKGKIIETEVCFAEAHTEIRKTRTDKEGKKSTYYETLFQGVIFIADFPKPFTTWLTVSPDNETDSFFSSISDQFKKLSGNLVKLENTDFEQKFIIRCPDEDKAIEILTPDLQDDLIQLRNEFGESLRVSIKDSKIHITFEKAENWFNPSVKVSIKESDELQATARQLAKLFGIVDLLNLNSKS